MATAKSIVRNLVKITIQLKRKIEKYIFYDFKATQSTGTHNINLSIAQDFNSKEYLHSSIEAFCKGLINDKFKGFIAHNSKGHDCHFILKWLIDQGIKPYCIYNRAKIMFMEVPNYQSDSLTV